MFLLGSSRTPAGVGDDMARKAAGENFPVALRVLPRRVRRHLHAVYAYARHVDDLGDEAYGDRTAALKAVVEDVHRLYSGMGAVDDPVVAALAPTVRECGLPPDTLLRLAEANLQDQQVSRYETFDDLLGYCQLSADPVGEIVLHVFGQADGDRVALSDRVCTGLQLIEHWQDVAEDRRNGRVYLPAEDLRRFGVDETDLDAPVAGDAVRALVAFETDRALAWLDSGSLLVPALRGWARLAVSGYVAGGRAAARELARAGYDPLGGPPKPGGGQVAAAWARATVRSPG